MLSNNTKMKQIKLLIDDDCFEALQSLFSATARRCRRKSYLNSFRSGQRKESEFEKKTSKVT